MPRKYKRKIGARKYRDYSTDLLEEALTRVVDDGWAIYRAAEHYTIPYGTLYNKYKGLHGKKHGGPTVFTQEEERIIIESATTCGDWGFPISIEDLQMITKSFLDSHGRREPRFKENTPGRDWVYSLLDRHKDTISQRLSANIKRSRAATSKNTLQEYYRNLETTLQDIPSSNLFNFDETNMADDPGRKKLLYKRGKKYPENIINHSKTATTIMFCGSASGILLPPYVIYKSEHLWDRWTQDGPRKYPCCSARCCESGTRYNRSKSGWIDALTFTDWFNTVFLPHATQLPGTKVVVGDNLSSHFTDEVLELCRQNNISFVCLPPNSTHLTQPLDVSFFRPLKAAWRFTLLQWKAANPKATSIRKEEFPKLLKQTLIRMNEIEKDGIKNGVERNLISGFEATGLFPLNANRVLNKLPDKDNEQEFAEGFNNSLVDYLKEKRYSTVPVRGENKKKKKYTVIPGRSVSTLVSSDSSEDEEQADLTLSDKEERKDKESSEEVSIEVEEIPDILTSNTFVLVKIKSGKRNSVHYRYVAIIQDSNLNNEYRMIGLKCFDTAKKTFKVDENDEFVASREDILAVLPDPEVQMSGDRVKYFFKKPVDVFEQ